MKPSAEEIAPRVDAIAPTLAAKFTWPLMRLDVRSDSLPEGVGFEPTSDFRRLRQVIFSRK
jgi:hypothetical protein